MSVIKNKKSLVGGFRMIERKQTENRTTRCCDTKKKLKSDFEKKNLNLNEPFFSALYLCKTPYSSYPHKKICNPSASIYSSLNSIIMTTTKNKFRFGECFYKCSLPKKNACVLSVPKKNVEQ